jgi:hypothetical protein
MLLQRLSIIDIYTVLTYSFYRKITSYFHGLFCIGVIIEYEKCATVFVFAFQHMKEHQYLTAWAMEKNGIHFYGY